MTASNHTTRVLIVDDHSLVRDGIRLRLSQEKDLTVCGEAADIAEALRIQEAENPHVALIDISLKTGNGLDLAQRMLARQPSIRLIISSMHEEEFYAERALEIGAMGFVHKQDSSLKLVDAIRSAMKGKLYASPEVIQRLLHKRVGRAGEQSRSRIDQLTQRELEVFERLGQGETVKEIASALKLSPKTVETYRDRIRQKLDIESAHALQHYAFRWASEHTM